ncbi:MAG: hypothetical protein LBT36_03445, partial [Oscillospiraceae bacterium]|nr:hypothetical protein [Oscillospiraceae bacterium]
MRLKKVFTGLVLMAALCACAPAAVTPIETETPSAPPNGGFSLDERFERWYPGAALEFMARADYGAVYPYIGGVQERVMPTYTLYGFATEDGKIVCDPVFNEVRTYEFEGARAYLVREAAGDAADAGTDEWASELWARDARLISGDGTFSARFDAIYSGGDGTFTVCEDGKWGSVDFGGNVVLPLAYPHPVYYGDGLFVVTRDLGAGYSFLDAAGETVLGPFAFAFGESGYPYEEHDENTLEFLQNAAFRDGFARMYTDGLTGLMDK